MDEFEERLTEWGRKWRDRQPVSGRPRFDTLSGQGPFVKLSKAFGVIAIGAVVVVWVGILSSRSEVGAGKLSSGSEITGTGWLIQSADSGDVQLCLGGFSRVSDSPTCSVVAVAVKGVQWDTVPGAQRDAGAWFAPHVFVRGTWTGSEVRIESVTAAPLSNSGPPVPASCGEDDATDGDPNGPPDEAALQPINAEVLGNPDRYAGLWRAASADGTGVMVVEVVGDVSAVEAKLRRLYPYALCLVKAKFSETQLNSTLRAIGPATQKWRAEVDYPTNRVIVSVATSTDEIQERLEPFLDRISIRPLLEPA
jgi:hypothetical protein